MVSGFNLISPGGRLIHFMQDGKPVLTITPDGRLVIGEGLSMDEATQQAAKLLVEQFARQFAAQAA